MTPEMLGIIIPVVTGLAAGMAALVRWAVNRITKAMDDSRTADAELREAWTEVRVTLAAMVEQGRIRDMRRRRESSLPPFRGVPGGTPADVWGEDETTDINHLIERERAKATVPKRSATQPGGVRAPRKGNHHDGDE